MNLGMSSYLLKCRLGAGRELGLMPIFLQSRHFCTSPTQLTTSPGEQDAAALAMDDGRPGASQAKPSWSPGRTLEAGLLCCRGNQCVPWKGNHRALAVKTSPILPPPTKKKKRNEFPPRLVPLKLLGLQHPACSPSLLKWEESQSALTLSSHLFFKHAAVAQGHVLFYLPCTPPGALGSSLLLVMGARREEMATLLVLLWWWLLLLVVVFLLGIQLSTEINQAGLYLESRGS